VDPDGADNVLGGAGGADDNFHLASNSPALDAGDPASDYALTASATSLSNVCNSR
jgi:hypothetical protein